MKFAYQAVCRILPKPTAPTTRYMTRDEVIGFVSNTPGIVVRKKWEELWQLPIKESTDAVTESLEYTTATLDGVYGEPMEFRKEVE